VITALVRNAVRIAIRRERNIDVREQETDENMRVCRHD
jgi:hypothetical protein